MCQAPSFHWAVSRSHGTSTCIAGSNGGRGCGGRSVPRIAVTAPSHVCSACARVRWRMVVRFLAASSSQELPRGGRLGRLDKRRCRRSGRSGRCRQRVEMPHARVACRVRMRVARVDAVHDVLRQAPRSPAAADFRDGQFDDGRVADVVAVLGADDQRHRIAALDGHLAQLLPVGLGGDRLRAAGADRSVGEDAAAGSVLAHDRPVDAVAALGVAHRNARLDAYASLRSGSASRRPRRGRASGCIATERAGIRKLPAVPCSSVGLAPNQGMTLVAQPRTSGTPGMASILVAKSSFGGAASAWHSAVRTSLPSEPWHGRRIRIRAPESDRSPDPPRGTKSCRTASTR